MMRKFCDTCREPWTTVDKVVAERLVGFPYSFQSDMVYVVVLMKDSFPVLTRGEWVVKFAFCT